MEDHTQAQSTDSSLRISPRRF